MTPAEIKTIKTGAEAKIKEKASVFIANSRSISDKNDASDFLKEIRRKYFDASHHCYAYSLQDGTLKSSDDGEPAGTAGLKILNAIDHFGLTNTLVVVTRYFGGTKLGKGLLAKTYYASAESSLLSSEIITLTRHFRINIITDFEHMSTVHNLLKSENCRIINIKYTETVEFECFIKPQLSNSFSAKVSDITKGAGKITMGNDDYLI